MSSRPIRDFMTKAPLTINATDTVAIAHKLMREKKIRHLPVVDGGKLVGIVSDRDLHWVATLREADVETLTIDAAMMPEPYTVGPDTPLKEVAEVMAKNKYGSVVVTEADNVVGVFTTVDGMRVLADLLT